MNNIVLILSGVIFCFNVITNVFIQVDFGYILNEATTSGVRPTAGGGLGEFVF